jgi:tRNA (guanine10-N2)-methyltransferase
MRKNFSFKHFTARWGFVYVFRREKIDTFFLRMSSFRRFMLYFAQENIDFRYPEINSLIKFFKLDIKVPKVGDRPYWILENVVESDLRKIASRSMSLRYIVEVYSTGKSYASFHENLKKYCSTQFDPNLLDQSFRVTVDTYNKHFGHSEKIDRIETMTYLPLTGKIELKNPENNFIYFEHYGMDPINVPAEPEEILFGRWVRNRLNSSSFKLISLLFSSTLRLSMDSET